MRPGVATVLATTGGGMDDWRGMSAGDLGRGIALGEIDPVALAELQVGERIRVAGGESVPVDGVLELQATRVDESLLSGETTALPKQPGELVLAGSIALDAPLTLRVSAVRTPPRRQ